jgi:hypothetical protein
MCFNKEMTKIRKITSLEMAIEQYNDYCDDHHTIKNGSRKRQTINVEYSYLSPKQGYWYLRDNYGWMIAFVDRYKGKVFFS